MSHLILLSVDQQSRVKRAYAKLDKAQQTFDGVYFEVDRELLEIAKELGLENLSNTQWGLDFTSLAASAKEGENG